MTLEQLLCLAGLTHFGILCVSFCVPKVLNWRQELAGLSPFLRRLFWVYGIFISLVILSFGLITVFNAAALSEGTALARSFCGFVAVFWSVRLVVQFTAFSTPPLSHWFFRLGYHALTFGFAGLVAVYGWAALAR